MANNTNTNIKDGDAMSDCPRVTAVVPTHNRPNLLRRALDSVAAQTYDNLELVIVDDGSEPSMESIAEEYKEMLPVQFIRSKQSQGACRARNRGIKEASGNVIAGLDDDDAWHPDRIAELVAAYSDQYSCVTSDTVMAFPRKKGVWKKKELIDYDTLLYTNQVGNQVLARRDRLLEVGGFDPNLRAAQDYDLWLRLCKSYGPIRNVQKPLQTVYMDHDGERITSRSSFEGYLQFYNKHKQKFNRAQQKYKLYNIRRAQRKPESITEFLSCVPAFRYWKEIKRMVQDRFWR